MISALNYLQDNQTEILNHKFKNKNVMSKCIYAVRTQNHLGKLL